MERDQSDATTSQEKLTAKKNLYNYALMKTVTLPVSFSYVDFS